MVQLHVIYATVSLHRSSINPEVVSDLNLLNEASQTLCDNNMLFCVSNKERNCSSERDAKFTVQIITPCRTRHMQNLCSCYLLTMLDYV